MKGISVERNIIAGKIYKDLKGAIKNNDKPRISALRMLLSALKNAELEEREELVEEQEMAVLASYAKRCRESIEEFRKGGRDDLIAKEVAELEVVMSYLPEQMNEEEITEKSKEVIAELEAAGPRDIGRVMGEMMKRFRGRVDGKTVNRIVSDLLRKG
ncbi:MAG: GatB/YqeY domain-containing protein [bacterium]|nr:MAG: GatB/YqeY domain-containing protein [bacterium]